jgi:hypothetical protein
MSEQILARIAGAIETILAEDTLPEQRRQELADLAATARAASAAPWPQHPTREHPVMWPQLRQLLSEARDSLQHVFDAADCLTGMSGDAGAQHYQNVAHGEYASASLALHRLDVHLGEWRLWLERRGVIAGYEAEGAKYIAETRAPAANAPQLKGARNHLHELRKHLDGIGEVTNFVVHMASERDDSELARQVAHLLTDLHRAEEEHDLVLAGLDGQLVGGAAEVRS